MARLIALLMLAALPAQAQVLSPGPLSRAHADLEGDGKCTSCHEEGRGVPDARCLDCHGPIGTRLKAGRGYHGKSAAGKRCASCHREHLGARGALVRWPGGRAESFDHERAGYPLRGAHARVECRSCHASARIADAVVRRIEGTWLGLPTACAACHREKDPHRGQFGLRGCEGCHDETAWKPALDFDHGRTKFPLRGRHAPVPCAKCHAEGRFAGVDTRCVACHRQPHPAPTRFGDDCARCHGDAGWKELRYERARHKTFPLAGGHDLKPCGKCHGEGGNRAPKRDCQGCHRDPHAGRLGQKCDRCHGTVSWHRVRKSEVDHDRTRYPLRGRHPDVKCARCHPRGKLAPIPHDRCLDCHRDVHEGKGGERCEDCHRVEGFQPALWPASQHTKFPLDGAHGATPCNACHRPDPKQRWDFRRGVTTCVGCHRDPHRAQFGDRTCEACHTAAAWRGGFKHDIWKLEGKHATAACAACHPDGQYAGVPKDCRGCHGSPHLGQFDVGEPVKDCTACHGVETWKGTFDHAAVWPLEGKHAAAKCGDCHREVRVGDDRVTVRWRLGFTACGRCHQTAHRGGGALFEACERCHAAEGWRVLRGAVSGFDHDATGFGLRGAHTAIPCTACHGEVPLRDAACARCHVDAHRGELGDRCDACHTSRSWRIPAALADHRRTRLPLVGRHATVPCRDCHPRLVGERYAPVPAACAACHQRQAFAAGVHPDHRAAGFGQRCEGCHTTYGWRPADVAHGRFWPLTGAHRATPCYRCHPGTRYAGTPRDCSRCHEDDFGRGHSAGDPRDCERCHITTAWLPASMPDHNAIFPLRHGGARDCAACHPSGSRSLSCSTCHAHGRDLMASEHRGVNGYASDARACYRCHPRGSD